LTVNSKERNTKTRSNVNHIITLARQG